MPHSWIILDERPSFGYSPTQARHSALLVASVLHTLYFIMMGSQGGFPVMFVAYALAAFARAILSGKIITLSGSYQVCLRQELIQPCCE